MGDETITAADEDASGNGGEIGAIVGKYEIRHVLGSGGTGIVLAAYDTELRRSVAIKFLVRESEQARARLVREAQAMARLSHPNVVTVYEVLRVDRRIAIVMELIEGRDLDEWQAGDHGWRDIVAAYLQAGRGLVAAHRAGLVHRDFKPANALIDADGVVRVADFGLVTAADGIVAGATADGAALADDLTRTGAVLGTPAYMAPEQFADGVVDARSDQWALACSLYCALYKQRPFEGHSPSEVRRSVLADALRAEPETRVPRPIRAAIRRALARDPRARFATLDDFLRAITPRRRTWAIAGVVLAVVAIGAVIVVERIADARERANASELDARHRADELELERARALVESDPNHAVALLKRQGKDRWRQVRAIAAGARAAGVAYALPASPHTHALALDDKGSMALSVGEDGVVRVHDLVARQTRELVRVAGAATARFAGERVVVAHPRGLALVERDGKLARAVEADVAASSSAGTLVYFVDAEHRLWHVDLAGTAPPTRDDSPEEVLGVAVSPAGDWLIAFGVEAVLALDLADRKWHRVTRARAIGAEWGKPGYVVVALERGALLVSVDADGAQIFRRTSDGRGAASDGASYLFTLDPSGVYNHHLAVIEPLAEGAQLATTTDCVVARGRDQLVIACSELDGSRAYRLYVPGIELSALAASRHSPYVIAATRDRVLVWNTDDVRGRRVAYGRPQQVAFGRDHAIVAAGDRVDLIQLATGESEWLSVGASTRALATAPTAPAAIVIDDGGEATYHAAGATMRVLAQDAIAATFIGDRTAAVATRVGLELVDLASDARTPLVRAPVVQVAASSTTIAAVLADGTAWRYDVATKREERVQARAGSVAVRGDQVVLGSEAGVAWWQHDGALAPISSLPARSVAIIGDDVLVTTRERSYQVGVARLLALPVPVEPGRVSRDGGLYAQLQSDRVVLTDPVAGESWVVARGRSWSAPWPSPDGQWLVAGASEITVWRISRPADADATRRWLTELTNATLDDPTGTLVWR